MIPKPPIVPAVLAVILLATMSPVIFAAEAVISPEAFSLSPVFPLAPLDDISVEVIPKPPIVPAVLAVIVLAVMSPVISALVAVNVPSAAT